MESRFEKLTYCDHRRSAGILCDLCLLQMHDQTNQISMNDII